MNEETSGLNPGKELPERRGPIARRYGGGGPNGDAARPRAGIARRGPRGIEERGESGARPPPPGFGAKPEPDPVSGGRGFLGTQEIFLVIGDRLPAGQRAAIQLERIRRRVCRTLGRVRNQVASSREDPVEE